MATTKLYIVDDVIDVTTAVQNRYSEEVSPDGLYFRGNGWEVKLEGGKIVCHSERKYSDGVAKCHRVFPLKDGMLGLAGGNVRERYAYFRDEEFVQFLHDYRVTTMKRGDPDGTYTGHQEYSARNDIVSSLYTDGLVEEQYCESWSGAPNYQTYKGNTTWVVTGATWVVHKEGRHVTLITRRSVEEMKKLLPNFAKG